MKAIAPGCVMPIKSKQDIPLRKGTRGAAFMAETLNVFGVFEDHNQAELALHELKRAGLRDDQLGFAVRERRSSQTDARERAAVVAGGILLTPLVSAAVGALVGDVIGGLVAMGLPENAAHHYAREFEAGRTLVSVKADGPQQARQALDILLRLGARDVQVH